MSRESPCPGLFERVLEEIFIGCPEDRVYLPSDDTYLLEDVLKREVSGRGPLAVLEVGSGTGYLGCVVCIENRESYIVATDIDPVALECTRRVLETCCCRERTDIVLCRSGSCLREGSVDIVFSNPPYLPSGDDTRWGGGSSGIEVAKEIIENTWRALRTGGRVLVVLSSLGDLREFLKRSLSLGYSIETVKWSRKFFETLVVFRLLRRG